MPTRTQLLDTYMDAAIAALAGGDYATALQKALAAQGIIATLPKASRSGGPGGGEQSASWDAAGIDNFVRNCRRQHGASLGIQTMPAVFSEPTPSDQGEQFANSSGGYVQ